MLHLKVGSHQRELSHPGLDANRTSSEVSRYAARARAVSCRVRATACVRDCRVCLYSNPVHPG
eukprot:6208877-Pleurochrysis_carterae.AAC.2